LEDKKWKHNAVGKYVYFRWSTACNSKNRFKGVVTDHWSRVTKEGRTVTSTINTVPRTDFLVVKTFGYSEDTYVMGKDIREIFLLPNKSILMSANSDDDVRKLSIRRWHCKEGWTEDILTSGTPKKPTSTIAVAAKKLHLEKSASSTLCSGATTAGSNSPVSADIGVSKIVAPMGKKQKRSITPSLPTPLPSPASQPAARLPLMTSPPMHAEVSESGIYIFAQHSKKSLIARRLANRFAFANGIIY